MDEQQRYARARAQVNRLRQFYLHLTVYILVNAFLALMSLFNGSAWFVWPLLGWGIGLGVHAVTIFVNGGLLGPLGRSARSSASLSASSDGVGCERLA